MKAPDDEHQALEEAVGGVANALDAGVAEVHTTKRFWKTMFLRNMSIKIRPLVDGVHELPA